jgi:plasmid stabilization system protein ParE
LPEVTFSRQAESDLQSIDEYTFDTWGEARTGLRRIEQGSHVIFYRETPSGILIIRILHRSMLRGQHALGET